MLIIGHAALAAAASCMSSVASVMYRWSQREHRRISRQRTRPRVRDRDRDRIFGLETTPESQDRETNTRCSV